MKYILETLNQLRSARTAHKKAHLEYEGADNVHLLFLKKIRSEARREHREYRTKYRQTKKIGGQIKRLNHEIDEHKLTIKAEKTKLKNSLDNIIIETNHENKEEFLTNAIVNYALIQPVRFQSVICDITQYEMSSKLYKIHKACKQIVSSKLDDLQIQLQEV